VFLLVRGLCLFHAAFPQVHLRVLLIPIASPAASALRHLVQYMVLVLAVYRPATVTTVSLLQHQWT
jgi:hypothetical protein